jgi:hypothetical protein
MHILKGITTIMQTFTKITPLFRLLIEKEVQMGSFACTSLLIIVVAAGSH